MKLKLDKDQLSFVFMPFAPTDRKEKVILGIDDGGKYVGYALYSAVAFATNSGKILETGVIYVGNRIKKKLEQRRGFRRGRRSKLGSRPKRFENRKAGTSPCVWCGANAEVGKDFCGICQRSLSKSEKAHIRKDPKYYKLPPPSIKAKKDCVLRAAKILVKRYDIKKVIVETATFDFQKLADPDIEGKEYQQGPGYGYHTKKQALTSFYGWRCAYCGAEDKKKLEIEHIRPVSRGGTSQWENLALACVECNRKKGNRTPEEAGMKLNLKYEYQTRSGKRKVTADHTAPLSRFMYAAHVQAGKTYLVQELRKLFPEVKETNGSMTSYWRKQYEGLEKSHSADAMIIASFGAPRKRGEKRKLDYTGAVHYKIKAQGCKTKQKYNASTYSLSCPAISELDNIRGKEVLRIRSKGKIKGEYKLNKQFVEINNRWKKKVTVNDSIRDRITEQEFFKGDLVKTDGLIGRITKILSSGSVGIMVSNNGNSKEYTRIPKKFELLSRARVLFEEVDWESIQAEGRKDKSVALK